MRAWIVWTVTTLCLAAYAAAGWVAARGHIIDIELTSGATAELTFAGLFEYRPPLRLFFKSHGCEQRPELGQSQSPLTLRNPGADVRLALSDNGAAPILFEALPLSGICSDINIRRLTSDLPPAPQFVLKPGLNRVAVQVAVVEPPLVGERVRLSIDGALGFKQSIRGNYLWFWILWPLFALSQVVWALVLLIAGWRRRRAIRLRA